MIRSGDCSNDQFHILMFGGKEEEEEEEVEEDKTQPEPVMMTTRYDS